MEEILLNYQGIIGAIAGTVLGTVTTLITTHILRNYGKVETSIFDIETQRHYKDSFDPHDRISLYFKVKFYNSSESNKVLDDFKVVYLDNKNKELYTEEPNDIDTFRQGQFGGSIDKLYFVNLSPKQLTLKKLRLSVTDSNVKDLDQIRTIKLKFLNKKRKKNYVIYKR